MTTDGIILMIPMFHLLLNRISKHQLPTCCSIEELKLNKMELWEGPISAIEALENARLVSLIPT